MTLTEILIYILTSSFVIQIIYIIVFHSRVTFHKNQTLNQSFGVSIIICSRNEEENLKLFLPKVLNQKYENFEVIVVNDRSWDNSNDFLKSKQKEYNNLKIVNIPDNGSDHFGKKLALTLGIKASKHEYLLFTDADCYPINDLWLKEMSSGFLEKKELVLGASSYIKEKGVLNKLIRFDTAQIAINYLGLAKSKLPYMGVGRNLAYCKNIYKKVSGFKSHYHIASGDDDLFINQVSNKKNTEIIFNENSITLSKPKKTWRTWIRQKRRHHTTNSKYKIKHKILLTTSYTSLLLYYLSIFSLIIRCEYLGYISILFMVRSILLMVIYYKPFKILLCKDLLWAIPIYEIILLFCQPIFQLNLNNSKK